MIRFPLYGKDADPESPISQIMELAQGIPIQLDIAPTAANSLQLLPYHGDKGWYGNNLYENKFGTVVKFIATVV